MGVTVKLLRLYRVDQQLRGLRSRLTSAESYLKQQGLVVGQLEAKLDSLRSQLRQLEATEHNDETEIKSIDARIAQLRERMNSARTSKEHSAFLTEINTLKADRGLIEERAIESLTKLEALRKEVELAETEKGDREKVREVARKDRDARAAEIKDRVAELEKEREAAVKDIPADAMRVYAERLESGAEEIMAPCEEENRRDMSFTCGSCFTHLPIEQANILLKRGDLTRCPSCHAILYMEESLADDIRSAVEKKRSKRTVPADS